MLRLTHTERQASAASEASDLCNGSGTHLEHQVKRHHRLALVTLTLDARCGYTLRYFPVTILSRPYPELFCFWLEVWKLRITSIRAINTADICEWKTSCWIFLLKQTSAGAMKCLKATVKPQIPTPILKIGMDHIHHKAVGGHKFKNKVSTT